MNDAGLHLFNELLVTFASSEGGDLSGSGSNVVDDGILEPGYPEENAVNE